MAGYSDPPAPKARAAPKSLPGSTCPDGEGTKRVLSKERKQMMLSAMDLHLHETMEFHLQSAPRACRELPWSIERDGRAAHVFGPTLEEPVSERLPLLVVLHGNGKSEDTITWLRGQFGELAIQNRCLMLIPSALGVTWDFYLAEDPQDTRFISEAISEVLRSHRVDVSRIAVMGFSDGASLGLSLAVAHPWVFQAAMVWGAGFCLRKFGPPPLDAPVPRLLVGHGRHDVLFNVDKVTRPIIERLEKVGYAVDFWLDEDAAHGPTTEFMRNGIQYWLDLPPRSLIYGPGDG